MEEIDILLEAKRQNYEAKGVLESYNPPNGGTGERKKGKKYVHAHKQCLWKFILFHPLCVYMCIF